jgi:peptidoglycan/xylan/chitin deacetylase (PgdA/CDA1 family)
MVIDLSRNAYSSALLELASMKKVLFALLYRLGVTRFTAWCHRRRVTILCYHGVTKHADGSLHDPKALHVNHLRFAAHLDFLQRNYNVVSLGDYLLARSEGRSLGEYTVVLTFDDGFRNFLTVAAPLLAERKLPATVFLITDKATQEDTGERRAVWTPEDDRQYLSWPEARKLKQEYGFEFGSHTCSHSPLLGLSVEDTDRELLHSFNQLVTQLGVERPTLSYPKGEYSSILAEDARKLGYACAVTTDRGQNELDHDLFTLGRALIGNNDDQAAFAVRASGLRWLLVKLFRVSDWRRARNSQPIPAARAAGEPSLQLGD